MQVLQAAPAAYPYRSVTNTMHAIGSSYLVRQAAGAERFGGVTVKIRPRRSGTGAFEVSTTDWRTDETIDDDVRFLADAATEGIKRFARDNDVNLDDWDITVSRFAYHPVDSSVRTTQIAAYNAIASALASWHSVLVKPVDA